MESIRAGDYTIEFGVEGAAEGNVARATLAVTGDDVVLFSLGVPLP
eukprot:SAG22_NODE_14970_length_360_cov_0.996169_1_plen_46_part_00